MPWLNTRFGNLDHPAYIPIMFMDYSDKLSFLERVENTLMYILNKILHYFLFEVPGNNAVRKFIGEDIPTLSKISQNSSLLLVNTHFTLNRPRPYVPNVIEVGGMHIGATKKLPKVSGVTVLHFTLIYTIFFKYIMFCVEIWNIFLHFLCEVHFCLCTPNKILSAAVITYSHE